MCNKATCNAQHTTENKYATRLPGKQLHNINITTCFLLVLMSGWDTGLCDWKVVSSTPGQFAAR